MSSKFFKSASSEAFWFDRKFRFVCGRFTLNFLFVVTRSWLRSSSQMPFDWEGVCSMFSSSGAPATLKGPPPLYAFLFKPWPPFCTGLSSVMFKLVIFYVLLFL